MAYREVFSVVTYTMSFAESLQCHIRWQAQDHELSSEQGAQREVPSKQSCFAEVE